MQKLGLSRRQYPAGRRNPLSRLLLIVWEVRRRFQSLRREIDFEFFLHVMAKKVYLDLVKLDLSLETVSLYTNNVSK